jgi:2-iminobutanoate/2-iminopropanoate deaminase
LNYIILKNGDVKMENKVLSTEKAPAAIGPYSQGIVCGDFVYTSGQLPIDMKTGELVKNDIKEATKQSLLNIENILKEASLTLDDVVKTTIFIKDINNFVDMNEVYASFFKKNPPARSCVEVARLPKDAPIEIEAIARIK